MFQWWFLDLGFDGFLTSVSWLSVSISISSVGFLVSVSMVFLPLSQLSISFSGSRYVSSIIVFLGFDFLLWLLVFDCDDMFLCLTCFQLLCWLLVFGCDDIFIVVWL